MIIELISAVFVAASVSFTISVTSIFAPVREWVADKHPKLEELIFCPYCLCHYVVFIMLLTSNIPLIPVSKFIVYRFLFTSFALVGGAGVLHYILLRAYEPVAKFLLQRKIDKLREIQNEHSEQ